MLCMYVYNFKPNAGIFFCREVDRGRGTPPPLSTSQLYCIFPINFPASEGQCTLDSQHTSKSGRKRTVISVHSFHIPVHLLTIFVIFLHCRVFSTFFINILAGLDLAFFSCLSFRHMDGLFFYFGLLKGLTHMLRDCHKRSIHLSSYTALSMISFVLCILWMALWLSK